MSNKVVARFLDGRLIKGASLDVDPARPSFHVLQPPGPAAEVKLADLKALFFVRTLEGNAAHEEASEVESDDPRVRGSKLVSLQFADGENLVGMTIRYPPNRPYFFVVPVDPKSNNIRVLVNQAALTSMKQLDT